MQFQVDVTGIYGKDPFKIFQSANIGFRKKNEKLPLKSYLNTSIIHI